MYDEKSVSRKTSRSTLRGGSERNRKASAAQQPDPTASSFNRELRVRASSPLLGRSYHTNQPSAQPPFNATPETPKLHKSGSFQDIANDHSFEKYAFDTQSQRSLAYGMVEDMRGIGFPHLEQGQNGTAQMTEHPKRKPSRLDLSLLFPRPKPAAAPLLSPQRYTHSPSPVGSEYSAKQPPNRLTKPRSKSNGRPPVQNDPIPEEPVPRIRRASQKPVDWFDVPLEKIIRLGESGDAEDMQEEDETEKSANERNRQSVATKLSQPSIAEPAVITNSAKISSILGSDRMSFAPSTVSRRTSRDSRTSAYGYSLSRQQLPPQSLSRMPGSLQSWQSEGDLRSSQKRTGRLSKKKSSSTFMTLDLTKNSVLSLSSSESESEDADYTDEDEYEGEQILSRAAPHQAGLRDSFATNDYIEPEICRAEAVIATKSYGVTRLNRANSNVSSVSSGSRGTARRPIGSRTESLSSTTRSSVSGKMYGSPSHFDIPLIEEPEEQTDPIGSIGRPQQRVQRSNGDIHSAKRRSRIIAVTRQEETLLEAMRQRNGRITPSIFKDIEGPGHGPKDSEHVADTKRPPPHSTAPKIRSPESIQTEFDTSFLRLSTAMRLSLGSAPAAGENTSSKEKDTCTSLGSASDSEQKTDSSNNYTASPRLSLAYSETPSSTSTLGHASPVTPTLPIHRFSPRAPPPLHAPPPLPEDAMRRHSRRRTDSSEAIVLAESESAKSADPPYPLWAVKWGRDPNDLAIVH